MVTTTRPTTLKEALLLMDQGHQPLAGGTDLMVRHRIRSGVQPAFESDIVFVDNISELHKIEFNEEQIEIGASVTLSDIAADTELPNVLRQATLQIAAPATRNRATLAGNICNASPAADSLPALYLLNAKVRLASLKGVRELPIEEFITAPGKTSIANDELLTHVLVPHKRWTNTFYHKVGTRAANALAKISMAGVAQLDENGQLESIRITFGAVAPMVVRAKDIEALLVGKDPEEIDIAGLLAQYNEIICPIDDQRSTAVYRRKAALNLLKKFIRSIK